MRGAMLESPSPQVVAEPPPPAPVVTEAIPEPPPRRRSSGRLLLVGGGTAVVVAVIVALLARHLAAPDDREVAATASAPYLAPVRVPVGNAFVRTQVVAPDSLRVTHWVHTDRPVTVVRVGAAQAPGVAAVIGVSKLVVAADGRTVLRERAPSAASAHTYVVPPSRRIFVTYVLTGALQRSDTLATRALAPLTALDVSTVQAPVHQATYSVVGAQVLQLACSANEPTSLPRPCGTVRDGSWQVDLRGPETKDRVIAQLDLP